MFTNEQLLEIADSFSIDPLLGVTLERRSENTWALVDGGRCLDKDTGEWEYESTSSNRTAGFISATRFNSIEKAVKYYINWRKERLFVFMKSKSDCRWNCLVYGKNGKDEKDIMNFWTSSSQVKPGIRERHGLWVLVGRDFRIIDQYKRPDASSEGVEFVDIIAEIAEIPQ